MQIVASWHFLVFHISILYMTEQLPLLLNTTAGQFFLERCRSLAVKGYCTSFDHRLPSTMIQYPSLVFLLYSASQCTDEQLLCSVLLKAEQ